MPRTGPNLADPAPDSPTDPATGTPLFTVERQILAYVRQGAYPHVAAQAAGVHPDRWTLWTNPRKPQFRAFQHKLRQAHAQARVRAELELFAAKPRDWLRNGPGKETADSPGWSGIAKPVLQSNLQVNILASPEWNGLWAVILSALSSFPDARAALADALAATGELPPPARTPRQLPPVIIDALPTDSATTPPKRRPGRPRKHPPKVEPPPTPTNDLPQTPPSEDPPRQPSRPHPDDDSVMFG